MLHFFVIKNLLPRFGKRDTASFMDLTYMEYLTAVLPINLLRLMIRHMSYAISVPQHELPYSELLTRVFEAFEVPLNDNEGIGANRRRDEDVEVENEQAQAKNVEVNEGENLEGNFKWEAVNKEGELQGEQIEKEAESAEAESMEKFYHAMDEERPADEDVAAPDVEVPAPAVLVATEVQTSVQPKKKTMATGVDPSGPLGHLPDFDLIDLQAEFALQANTRFQELYQQMQSNPPTSPKP
ncbi:hypothetical protein Dimus_010958 [Dionaea muscipula]